MLGRAAAALGAGQQRVEQRAQGGHVPVLARAELALQRGAQLAHVFRRHLLGLVAEDALGQRQRRLQAFFGASACGVCAGSYGFRSVTRHRAAHGEGQQPGVRRIVGRHAAHLQRADLAHAGLQLHFHLRGGPALGRGQHGGQGGQLGPALAFERGDLPGLGLALAARHQVEAHGLAEPQREAPPGQHQAHAFLGAARQQAQGLACAALGAGQHQPVAARGAAADARHYGFGSFWRFSCLG